MKQISFIDEKGLKDAGCTVFSNDKYDALGLAYLMNDRDTLPSNGYTQ